MDKRGRHARARRAGTMGWAGRVRLVAAGGLLCLGSLGVAGCTGDLANAGVDPLLGPSAAARPAAQAAGPAPGSVTPLPRLPAPSSLTSNAALASGAPTVPDSGQDLRIADAYRKPEAPASPGGTVLRRPEPVFQPAGLAAPAAPVAALGTFEQAQAALTARGVTWQRLETLADAGEWKFSCSVPNRQNPAVNRTYEARARDALSAIQAVIDQIDRER